MSLTDGLRWYGYLTETGSPLGWADAADDVGPFVSVGSVTAGASGVTIANGSYVRPLASGAFSPAGSFTLAGFVQSTNSSSSILILGKGNNGAGYYLGAQPAFGVIDWIVPGPGGNRFSPSASCHATNYPADGTTRTFVAVWVDRENGQIGLRVGGDSVTAAFTGDLYDTPAHPFTLGTVQNAGGTLADAVFDRWGLWHRVLSAAEIDTLAAGTVPLSEPDPVTAGESFTVSDPENGEAVAVYSLFGDPDTLPTVPFGGLMLFVDGEYVERLNPESGDTWYAASTTLDTSAIATGTHTATLEWLTADTSVAQPEKLEEAEFATSESLTRWTGHDPIYVEPNGTATINFRRLTTDNESASVSPFAVDWDGLGTQSGSTFTAGASEGVGVTDYGGLVVVRQARGVAHFGPAPDYDVRYGYQSGSNLTVSVYQVGPASFSDDRYGLTVRDEMLAAGLCVEGGGWWPPTNGFNGPTTTDINDWRASYATLITSGWSDGRWTGGIVWTGDDFWGLGFGWVNEVDPGLLSTVFAETAAFQNSKDSRGCVAVDEVNDRYGNDPTFTGELSPGYAPLSQFATYPGGLAALVAQASAGPPLSWGMFGLSAGPDTDRDYAGWLEPEYSDFITQYQATIAPASVTYGGHLRTDYITRSQYAARIRDPGRPFSTNYTLTRYFGYKQSDGSVPPLNKSMTAYSLGGSLWIAVANGASIARGYFLEAFEKLAQVAGASTGAFIERAVRPGDDLWDVFLTHATAVQDYAPQLLGTETSCPSGGPDFHTFYRVGEAGRVYVAINLSRLSARPPPFALEGLSAFNTGELLDGVERTSVEATTDQDIPAGGVLILSGTRRRNPLRWSVESDVSRWSFK